MLDPLGIRLDVVDPGAGAAGTRLIGAGTAPGKAVGAGQAARRCDAGARLIRELRATTHRRQCRRVARRRCRRPGTNHYWPTTTRSESPSAE